MKEGKRAGLLCGEGRLVCVGGLGNMAGECGSGTPAGELLEADKGGCPLGDSEPFAAAAKLAREDFLGMRGASAKGGFGLLKIEMGCSVGDGPRGDPCEAASLYVSGGAMISKGSLAS